MNGTKPSGTLRADADRRRSRRIRARNTGAFTPSQAARPLKRSRHWRRKILIFRILLAAFIAALAVAFYLILRGPDPAMTPSEPFRGLDFKRE
jgi:hypothetical protein